MPANAYIMRDQSRLCHPRHRLVTRNRVRLRRLARQAIEVGAFLAALAAFLVALALVA